jgi:hypothetical protein
MSYADVVKSNKPNKPNKQKFGFITDESGYITFYETTYDNYDDAKKNFFKFIKRFGDHAEFSTDYYASLETGASGIIFFLTDDFDNLKKEIDDIKNNDNINEINIILKYFNVMRRKNIY